MLRLENVHAGYAASPVLFGLSLDAAQGEMTTLLGRNGMGKTTTVRSIMGLTRASAGAISFRGRRIESEAPDRIARAGIALVPEGRQLFPSLSVEENLLMGTLARRPGRWTLATVYELFPVLREFRQRPATLLSGGQQQMVAIGRALMANPKLLLCDELSLGLAPRVVEEIYRAFSRIRQDGLAIVLVEQDVARACAASDRLVCLLKGRVTMSGPSHGQPRARIAAAYFGE